MVKHSSRIQLSQSALKLNFNFIRKKLSSGTQISSVVKANAYGHGIEQFVPMAEKCGINHFSTASAYEAEIVKSVCKETSSVMIMGILYEEDIAWAIENDIEFYVFNFDRLKLVREEAQKLNKTAKVHIEVETGANRTGMDEKWFKKAVTFLKTHPDTFSFEGLCTHFGGAESFSNKFKIDEQLRRYKAALVYCKQRKVTPKIRHIASSAATLAYPESHYDMVRVGVAQYGFWPSPDIFYHHVQDLIRPPKVTLKRIFTWKTDIMDIRDIKSGEFIGYGTAFQATHNMRVAVLPIGYSNGYPRALSNRGQVLIKGKKAPITGLINMNLFMVDITHIKGVEVGDEVVLIGRQGNNVINISSFTNITHQLNNEMLSRLPYAIPRKVVL